MARLDPGRGADVDRRVPSKLDGREQKFDPGTAFSYCNRGYVVLALVCDRVTGTEWPELIARHVTRPADMTATEYLDIDRLPADTAIGYLDDGRTNAGISFRSIYHRERRRSTTIISNTTDGAWPVARILADLTTPE